VRKRREASNLELVGGQLCLDFTNTYNQTEMLSREYLHTYTDLLAWGQHAGFLSSDEAQRLRNKAADNPSAATAVFDWAIALRATIYRIFAAVAQGHGPIRADITDLNIKLAELSARLQVVGSGEKFEWQWLQDAETLDGVLWPIAWSAVDLLTSADLLRVRQCAHSEACDWLFVDTSKNGSRRWCSMNLCGSQEKSRQYYRRKRANKGNVSRLNA
jgi:predicted RNA-binding Zn ribbon-like protein